MLMPNILKKHHLLLSADISVQDRLDRFTIEYPKFSMVQSINELDMFIKKLVTLRDELNLDLIIEAIEPTDDELVASFINCDPINNIVKIDSIKSQTRKLLAQIESVIVWTIQIHRINVTTGIQNSRGTSKTFKPKKSHRLVKVLAINPREQLIAHIKNKQIEITTKNENPLMSFFYKAKHTSDPIDVLIKKMIDEDSRVIVQEKLDGVRCFASIGVDGIVTLTSRHNKPIDLPYLNSDLNLIAKYLTNTHDIQKAIILDGELYNENMHVNKIAGFVNRKDNHCNCGASNCLLNYSSIDNKSKVCQEIPMYYVFDYNTKTKHTADRILDLVDCINAVSPMVVKYIPSNCSFECKDPKQAIKLFEKIKNQNREGIVIKKNGTLPAVSLDCFKIKTSFDDRYMCIDVIWSFSTNVNGKKSISCVLVFNGIPRDCGLNPCTKFKSTYVKPQDDLFKLYDENYQFIAQFFNVTYKSLSINGLPFHSTAHDIL